MSRDSHADLETAGIRIARVQAAIIYGLRQQVLRPGLPLASASFPGDDLPSSIHLAAVDPQDAVVGCASFMQVPYGQEPAWQLRGMATAPHWRRRGLGRALLQHAERLLAGDALRLWWCNARLGAIAFYEAQGWIVDSPEFDIEGVGPHRRMIRRLA